MSIDEQLLRRIYGAYYGCPVVTRDTKVINPNISNTAAIISYFEGYSMVPPYQLALLPASEILDEDVKKCVDLFDITHQQSYEYVRDMFIMRCSTNTLYEFFEIYPRSVKYYPQIVDMLRKKYDMGYAHIHSLIEAEIAININTLNV